MLLLTLGGSPGTEGAVLRIAGASYYPCVPFCMEKRGTKRVLEYSRLAMGFANVLASRYGNRECSGVSLWDSRMFGRLAMGFANVWAGTRVLTVGGHVIPSSCAGRQRLGAEDGYQIGRVRTGCLVLVGK